MSKKLPTRQEDYSLWYNELVKRAGLAENSAVRGCMVIKPYGYAIWEKMQRQLDDMFKRTGHENAYFPIFIPKSLFEAEEKNAEGFAKECAVVTHYRLQTDPDRPGKLRVDPNAKLEEELVVRPTSEAIIWSTYKNWIQSYRDLPLLINQWANVVRWEMRTRLFLRTAEFLWQEGHTAHATAEEAVAETRQMLDVYAEFAEEHMALPVVKGVKTPNERFAGAEDTYCIEALMQDGKALQAGTSHFLGQNFAKAFDVTFANKEGGLEHVWGTSWGVSTRLMGALVMAHSDDEGLVLPPKLAPIQVVIVPIYKTGELDALLERIRPIQQGLIARGIAVKVDSRDTERPGFKFAEWEMKGVPVRLAIGARDLDAGTVEVARRDTKEKLSLPLADIVASVAQLLDDIQVNIYQRAKKFRDTRTTRVGSYDEFKRMLDEEPGFLLAHYDGTSETEERIKEETKATVRCLALAEPDEDGICMVTGKPSTRRAYFARAY
ncbi:MAG TPA: proline--tRNA ligase [Hymenobacter sp.]|jgi:prolyl-tRNA synthetase|uniref:proline--tRNA ligase n=1 Tax=Hymenobacter sp. TaxID=1898978 RepID=UPI002ED974C6